VKKTAGLYLKSVMNASLKITEFGRESLLQMEAAVLQCVLVTDLMEDVIESVTSFLPQVYASRGYSSELADCADRSLRLMSSDKVKEKYLGVVVFECLVKALLGMEFSTAAVRFIQGLVPLMVQYYAQLRELKAVGSPETSYHQYIFSFMIKTFYRLINKVLKNKVLAVLNVVLTHDKLFRLLLSEIISDLCEHVDGSLSNTYETSIYSECMFLLNKTVEILLEQGLLDHEPTKALLVPRLATLIQIVYKYFQAHRLFILSDEVAAVHDRTPHTRPCCWSKAYSTPSSWFACCPKRISCTTTCSRAT
jgi:hypothetical protein